MRAQDDPDSGNLAVDELSRVQAAASRLLAVPVTEIVRLAGSVGSQDYRVGLLDDPPVIMKVGPADELAREAWVCQRLTGMGLPVPSVIAHSLNGGPLGAPVLILSLIAGCADDDPAVVASAGAVMRRVHEVQLPGFGPLVPIHGEWRGQYDSWAEAVAASVSAVPELVAAGVLDPELAQRAVQVATGPLVDFRGGGVLLHRDLKEAHLFGDAGALTGLIDWGDAWVGDPLLDLARLSMAPPAVFTAFVDGYGSRFSHELVAKLAAYRIGWNIDALGYEVRAGGDWFDVYRGRVAADVARLWARSPLGAVRRLPSD